MEQSKIKRYVADVSVFEEVIPLLETRKFSFARTAIGESLEVCGIHLSLEKLILAPAVLPKELLPFVYLHERGL